MTKFVIDRGLAAQDGHWWDIFMISVVLKTLSNRWDADIMFHVLRNLLMTCETHIFYDSSSDLFYLFRFWIGWAQ